MYCFLLHVSQTPALPYRRGIIYNTARPATPTAPIAQEAIFTCDAAPVGAGAELPLAPGAVLVPLGFPDMFCWETETPVPFLQWLS